MNTVGFIVTPGEIENRIAALDRAIGALDADVQASSSPKINTSWREQWDAFRARWGVERDSYATWDARLFATRVLPRIQEFELSYRWWLGDFRRRTGRASTLPGAQPSQGMLSSVLGRDALLWFGVAAAAWFLYSRGQRR